MRRISKLAGAIALSCFAVQTCAKAVGYSPKEWIRTSKRGPLQDIVTWDEDSLFVNGERLLLYSGEVHPYRLPVPDLHRDIFQKIKALGYNGVSFYVDWALLEGKPGTYRADGVFDLKPFFDAASEVGIYLIARPGPYINAEVSGGGFPGWLQRVNGTLRTKSPEFLKATDLYMASIGKTIADAQITNGGPIILVQPENEYTQATSDQVFPDPDYMEYIYKQLRDAGVVVPLISNDASPKGHNAPGQPAPVDIYGHDGYPLGFDCANPAVWPDKALPANWRQLHEQQSPSTPYSILEFQGGSFDPWGGPGFDKCEVLVSSEFQRVFYKNLYSFGVTILNLYMTFGGTNWGNLGHPGGYTSYDYAAVIREDRRVDREKYSEQKLQANFLKVSPQYLTLTPGNSSNNLWTTSTDLTVTVAANESTRFYYVRHAKYNTLDSTKYKLTIPTTAFGNITVPQIANTSLTLSGRDSKIHVSNYDIGQATLVYSTAEIFTWHKYEDKTVLVLYGGPGETHEFVLAVTGLEVLEGEVQSIATRGYTLVNFEANEKRKVVKVGVGSNFIYVYMLDRNSAYNHWSIDTAPHDSSHAVILKAGYLMRTAKIDGNTLSLTGDVNATTPIEILGGAPSSLSTLTFNKRPLPFQTSNQTGAITATIPYNPPELSIPNLSTLQWHYLDSLPELLPTYNSTRWTSASHPKTPNTHRPLTTPTSLYASDYGYHTGALLYSGTFTSTGNETTLSLSTSGGSAFAHSAWLDDHFLGSFRGYDAATTANSTFTLPALAKGSQHVITVLIDTMGLDENWTIGTEQMKNPRGILDYRLSGRDQRDVAWKLTGNLGGEDYADVSRGPLNEGGLFAERCGLHLPGALSTTTSSRRSREGGSSSPCNVEWKASKGPVLDGLTGPGVGFFAAEFELRVPEGWDVPMSFTFDNSTLGGGGGGGEAYRVQLYVNGWQYGKYVSNVGPQTKFPVPRGILDYDGTNYLAVTLWGLDDKPVKVRGLELTVDGVVWSAVGEVGVVDGERFKVREGAY
ncbi:glycoside hydrolase family 35 protein [Aaosphaeria arxii CBS 175.79]|uniref:Beta-galactosidase n=1 Tax=Aaosphaeria arxii CBS 175.79 TaxID=1450172 RepID=A0A6A5Y0H5_9PLEO|nr:glycoside hydrolase family 35 protein [Aaosphaeria arxii CBS 175.79]KAF2018726.1 glycoside hydrolase family 35 protein [Aaosphaeria arxii CBS 175.79]